MNSVRISDQRLICANVITIHQTDFNDFLHKLGLMPMGQPIIQAPM